MISMTIAILGATFLGCYGAVKLCIWEDNRKSSTVDEYDYELDDFDDFELPGELVDDFDDFEDYFDDFEPSWSEKELIHN